MLERITLITESLRRDIAHGQVDTDAVPEIIQRLGAEGFTTILTVEEAFTTDIFAIRLMMVWADEVQDVNC